jgi:hypothetical protein
MTPQQRLARMRASFDKKCAILLLDYEFFCSPRAVVKPRTTRKRRAKCDCHLTGWAWN